MVRIVAQEDVSKISDLIVGFFNFQKHFTHIVPVNYPEVENCIYAMWHNQQCCLYGVPDKERINVMISRSRDGEVIASAIERVFGFKTVRGSKAHKGAIAATKQMVEALKNGENGAITVDGPRGPLHKVNGGIIKIAKLSGVPIVPVIWYTSNFNMLKLPSWDKFEIPILGVRIINLYGKPIYVPQDGDDESDEKYRQELENQLLELLERAPEEYNKVYWHGLWRRK